MTGTLIGVFSGAGTTLSLNPATNFLPGEKVAVSLTQGIQNLSGEGITPYVWEFTTAAAMAAGDFAVAHPIASNFDGALSVSSADVDGDGDLDVLGMATEADDVTWWENEGGDGSTWTLHLIDGNFDGAFTVHAADVDGDGDVDVLGSAETADDVTWWENEGGDGSTWITHLIDGNFDGAFCVYSADVDGDGDMDVLGAALNADDVTWWENEGGGWKYVDNPPDRWKL